MAKPKTGRPPLFVDITTRGLPGPALREAVAMALNYPAENIFIVFDDHDTKRFANDHVYLLGPTNLDLSIYISQRFNIIDIRALRLGPLQGDIPPDEPFTCGTHHVAAQATLTMIQGLINMASPVNHNTIEALATLVNDAGWKFAMRIIGQGFATEEVPF